MSREDISLPPGRRQAALSEAEARRAESVFRGLNFQGRIEFEPEAGKKTRFTVRMDVETRQEEGLIIIGPDVFPGNLVANPNSVMDTMATAAHEITHFIRWQEGRELPVGHLDEAMTSLQAICTFRTALSEAQVEQLVSDALDRLMKFSAEGIGEVVRGLEAEVEQENAD